MLLGLVAGYESTGIGALAMNATQPLHSVFEHTPEYPWPQYVAV